MPVATSDLDELVLDGGEAAGAGDHIHMAVATDRGLVPLFEFLILLDATATERTKKMIEVPQLNGYFTLVEGEGRTWPRAKRAVSFSILRSQWPHRFMEEDGQK